MIVVKTVHGVTTRDIPRDTTRAWAAYDREHIRLDKDDTLYQRDEKDRSAVWTCSTHMHPQYGRPACIVLKLAPDPRERCEVIDQEYERCDKPVVKIVHDFRAEMPNEPHDIAVCQAHLTDQSFMDR